MTSQTGQITLEELCQKLENYSEEEPNREEIVKRFKEHPYFDEKKELDLSIYISEFGKIWLDVFLENQDLQLDPPIKSLPQISRLKWINSGNKRVNARHYKSKQESAKRYDFIRLAKNGKSLIGCVLGINNPIIQMERQLEFLSALPKNSLNPIIIVSKNFEYQENEIAPINAQRDYPVISDFLSNGGRIARFYTTPIRYKEDVLKMIENNNLPLLKLNK